MKLESGQRVEIFEKPVLRLYSLGKATLIRKATPQEYDKIVDDENYGSDYWLDLGCELWWVNNIEAFDRKDIEGIYAIKVED